MNQLIANNLSQINSLCRIHFVETLYLFGSATNATFKDKSDVDFLVTFSEEIPLLEYADNYFGLSKQLALLLNRKVDLVSEKSLKNIYLINEICKTKTLLYERKAFEVPT